MVSPPSSLLDAMRKYARLRGDQVQARHGFDPIQVTADHVRSHENLPSLTEEEIKALRYFKLMLDETYARILSLELDIEDMSRSDG